VNYAKLLEISSFFFTCRVFFLEVGKIQDLPSKIWQTVGDALTNVAQRHECLACSKLKKKALLLLCSFCKLKMCNNGNHVSSTQTESSIKTQHLKKPRVDIDREESKPLCKSSSSSSHQAEMCVYIYIYIYIYIDARPSTCICQQVFASVLVRPSPLVQTLL
jgi:hypothetical protein